MSRGVVTLVDTSTGEVVFDGHRVTRHKRCPVCGHDSWCLYDPERGSCICPRTWSPREIGKAGYLHGDVKQSPGSGIVWKRRAPERPLINLEECMAAMRQQASTSLLRMAAETLGVTFGSLMDLKTGYCPRRHALVWPMYDDTSSIIGIRVRNIIDHAKYAVPGSRNGLFVPPQRRVDEPVFLPEGPTSTAACISLGLDAIGVPFAGGGSEALTKLLARARRPAVVIGENDNGVGKTLAVKLAQSLVPACQWVRVIFPPPRFKDIRDWLAAGATRQSVLFRVGA